MNISSRRLSSLVSLLSVIVCIAIWIWQMRVDFPLGVSLLFLIGGIGLLCALAWSGRWLLDRKPAPEYARWVDTWMHAAIYLLLGCAIFEAVKVLPGWKIGAFPFPQGLGLALVTITSAATVLSMVNLALKGLGAPFAVALSRKVASDGMYGWTRNPMILSGLATLVAFGLYSGSAVFLLWALLLVAPALVFVLKVYEERELEIRFGDSYREYRRRVPFLWPRMPRRVPR